MHTYPHISRYILSSISVSVGQADIYFLSARDSTRSVINYIISFMIHKPESEFPKYIIEPSFAAQQLILGFEGWVPSLGFRKQTMHHSQTQRVFYPTVTRDLNPRAGIQHDTTPSKSIKKHQKGMLWRFITGVLHVNNRPLERNSQQQHTGAKSPCPVRSK